MCAAALLGAFSQREKLTGWHPADNSSAEPVPASPRPSRAAHRPAAARPPRTTPGCTCGHGSAPPELTGGKKTYDIQSGSPATARGQTRKFWSGSRERSRSKRSRSKRCGAPDARHAPRWPCRGRSLHKHATLRPKARSRQPTERHCLSMHMSSLCRAPARPPTPLSSLTYVMYSQTSRSHWKKPFFCTTVDASFLDSAWQRRRLVHVSSLNTKRHLLKCTVICHTRQNTRDHDPRRTDRTPPPV